MDHIIPTVAPNGTGKVIECARDGGGGDTQGTLPRFREEVTQPCMIEAQGLGSGVGQAALLSGPAAGFNGLHGCGTSFHSSGQEQS